jgi:hypothetical protein
MSDSKTQVWWTEGNRTVYARVFTSEITAGKFHYSDFVGAYTKEDGGFRPQHCRQKICKTEREAKQLVLRHGMNGHMKEIKKLQQEYNNL